ncbi:hypothetical protein [Diaphorobacter sp. LR2014-1]|uniref:hypothetical protein n=1 Tax=Diaphorobacter sp. LR2014-1 TaxID=1933219 RepID=UPI000D409339|nr:hypothetical protein [Diaphorobacter sp. LR2014-1]POR07987.1 hypothetical protein BV908_18570 [Diaphorobacter sp. LR2014-1]
MPTTNQSVVDFFAPHPVVLAMPDYGDAPKFALVIDDMQITDPTLSACGRFTVDPQEVYGLSPAQVDGLQSINKLLEDAVQDAINAGCFRIQNALGIATGDTAGVHFAFGPALNAITQIFGEYMLFEIKTEQALMTKPTVLG